jgi:hypothetical protein
MMAVVVNVESVNVASFLLDACPTAGTATSAKHAPKIPKLFDSIGDPLDRARDFPLRSRSRTIFIRKLRGVKMQDFSAGQYFSTWFPVYRLGAEKNPVLKALGEL